MPQDSLRADGLRLVDPPIPDDPYDGAVGRRANGHYRSRVPGEDDGPALPKEKPAATDPLTHRWKSLKEWGDWLNETPPSRKYLLTLDGKGVLQGGKAGMVVASGGAGKSWAMTLLALCVTSGKTWLGFKVETPGKVLLALGEEDAEEAQRRLYWGCQELGLSFEERLSVQENLVVLPLSGVACSLTVPIMPGGSARARARAEEASDDADGLPVTPFYWRLLERILAGSGASGWRLIIIDPLARFAAADAEKDNAAATHFVQALERLIDVPGKPSLLCSHHTNKPSRKESTLHSTDAAGAAAARGSTALTDAFRWQANLEPLKRVDGAPQLVVFRVVKSNYGIYPPDVYLARNADREGALHVASVEEYGEYQDAGRDAKDSHEQSVAKAANRSLMEAACEVVYKSAKPISGTLIAEILHKSKSSVLAVLRLAEQARLVQQCQMGRKNDWGWRRFPDGSQTVLEPSNETVPGDGSGNPCKGPEPTPSEPCGLNRVTVPEPSEDEDAPEKERYP